MGNGPGDIEDYYQLEEQYDTFVGGFVWEWCDHGVYMGTTDDGRKKFYYGGDSGLLPRYACISGIAAYIRLRRSILEKSVFPRFGLRGWCMELS